MGILSLERVESFDSWIRLGWCLHNIDYSLLDAWKDVSMNSPKYEDGVCEEKWEGMVDKGLSMGSLCKWAMEDNMAEEQTPQIGVTDLEAVVQIIDACSQRGAFKGDELASVGNVRNRINAFVQANKPVETTDESQPELPLEDKDETR